MRNNYTNVERDLETKLKQIESKLKSVDSTHDESPESTTELGTFSWHLQTQETQRAMHEHLIEFRETLRRSLEKLKKGAYGICEDCGNQIEDERLKVMPTAAICVACCTQLA
ncbi:TraR/DksA C4-type zinc finger protein [Candidatus Microgenomates bacterium]|nr:TraR/DksA C4-type zinc finger protein [Candidatus Microgenomates bacterium]